MKNAVRANDPDLNIDFINLQNVYAHSTADRLAEMMKSGLKGETATTTKYSGAHKLANLISRYTSDLPIRNVKLFQSAEASTVILTGSTGSLGTYCIYLIVSSTKETSTRFFS